MHWLYMLELGIQRFTPFQTVNINFLEAVPHSSVLSQSGYKKWATIPNPRVLFLLNSSPVKTKVKKERGAPFNHQPSKKTSPPVVVNSEGCLPFLHTRLVFSVEKENRGENTPQFSWDRRPLL